MQIAFPQEWQKYSLMPAFEFQDMNSVKNSAKMIAREKTKALSPSNATA